MSFFLPATLDIFIVVLLKDVVQYVFDKINSIIHYIYMTHLISHCGTEQQRYLMEQEVYYKTITHQSSSSQPLHSFTYQDTHIQRRFITMNLV